MHIYILCIYGKTGNKSMKMYQDEKTQGLLRMILFIELFANVRCFSF